MYKNGYGSISTGSGSSDGRGSKSREQEDRARRKAQVAARMSDDLDISAILAATSITSITGQPSKALAKATQTQKNATSSSSSRKDDDRTGKGKGKEKDRDGSGSASDRTSKGKGSEAGKNQEPIFHTVALTDTLEGIALKYGVQVADIKRVNRLFSNQDLFARKEVLIPSEEVEEETTRPRRSYERDIKGLSGRRSFETNGTPNYIYPATPEDEAPEQRKSLLGFGYNFSSQNGGEPVFGNDSNGVRIRQMGEHVRRRLEEEEDKLYGL